VVDPTEAEGGHPLVDLRSDTVTRPTKEMRTVMAEAQVGDDVYGEDPEVAALEAEVAAMFGHEAALFVPSGIMGNQIAIQLLVERGGELLCDAESHLVTYEYGAAAAVGGVGTRTWVTDLGTLDLDAVAAQVRPAGFHTVATAAVAVENTHNRGGGAVLPLDSLGELRELADSTGLVLHCDGARIWNAHVATGVPLEEYGGLFETLSVCLSKGLGAPIGSLVISSAERIARARDLRGRMGGAMRQVGVIAAAGRYAVKHHLERLADDHARAARIATALQPTGTTDPAKVHTNIVTLDLAGTEWHAPTLAAAAAELGVRISAFGPLRARLVTHLDLDDEQVERAIEVLRPLLEGALSAGGE
jgi:threonine aldolase